MKTCDSDQSVEIWNGMSLQVDMEEFRPNSSGPRKGGQGAFVGMGVLAICWLLCWPLVPANSMLKPQGQPARAA